VNTFTDGREWDDDGSLLFYLHPYLTKDQFTTANDPSKTFRETKVAKCPGMMRIVPAGAIDPKAVPTVPLKVPVSYFSRSYIINRTGIDPNSTSPDYTKGDIEFPFGRPNTPFAEPTKLTRILRPSECWSMADADAELLLSLGYNPLATPPSITYAPFIPRYPAHSAKTPAYRNYLYYDTSVRTLKTKQ
jgi:hypothetical protein